MGTQQRRVRKHSKIYPKLDVDLFATRLNCQLSTYCSWKLEPGSTYVDAFSIDWRNYTFYAFPPFNLIARCVQKITQDKAKGILIVPLWQTPPKLLPHPLHKKLHLMVCPLSGNPLENSTFLQKQQKLSWHHGEHGLKSNTRHTLRNTWTFVVKGVSITVNPM